MLAEKHQVLKTPEFTAAIQLPNGTILTDDLAYIFVTLSDNFRTDQCPISKCRLDTAYYPTSPFPQYPVQHLLNRLGRAVEESGMKIVTIDDPDRKKRDNTFRSAVALFVPTGIEPPYTVPEGSVFPASVPLPEGHPALPAPEPPLVVQAQTLAQEVPNGEIDCIEFDKAESDFARGLRSFITEDIGTITDSHTFPISVRDAVIVLRRLHQLQMFTDKSTVNVLLQELIHRHSIAVVRIHDASETAIGFDRVGFAAFSALSYAANEIIGTGYLLFDSQSGGVNPDIPAAVIRERFEARFNELITRTQISLDSPDHQVVRDRIHQPVERFFRDPLLLEGVPVSPTFNRKNAVGDVTVGKTSTNAPQENSPSGVEASVHIASKSERNDHQPNNGVSAVRSAESSRRSAQSSQRNPSTDQPKTPASPTSSRFSRHERSALKNPYRQTCNALLSADPRDFDTLSTWTLDPLRVLVLESRQIEADPKRRSLYINRFLFSIDRGDSDKVYITRAEGKLRVFLDALFLINGIKYHQRYKKPTHILSKEKKIPFDDFIKAIETVIADMEDYTPDYYKQNPGTQYPLALWSHVRAYLRALKVL